MEKPMVLSVIARSILAFCAAFSFQAGAQTDASQEHTVRLAPEEMRIFSFVADEKMVVSFRHLGKPEEALSCNGEVADVTVEPLKHCGGVYASDGQGIIEGGNYAEGVFGGIVSFAPVDGKITVALKNLSATSLEFSIKATARAAPL